MPNQPPRRQTRPENLLIDVAALETALLQNAAQPRRPPATRQLRHQRPPRHLARTAPSPRPTSSPSPRPSANTAKPKASTARSSWAKTPTPLSGPAQRTALEVLAANGVDAVIQANDGFTPTPVISRRHPHPQPRPAGRSLADGIVITPSHNPPADGGFKYNPTNGGPADTDITKWIQDRANELLKRRQPRRETHAL